MVGVSLWKKIFWYDRFLFLWRAHMNLPCKVRASLRSLSFRVSSSVRFLSVKFSGGRWTKFSSLFKLFFGASGSAAELPSVVNGFRPRDARSLFVSSMDNDARSVPSRVPSDVSFAVDFVGVGDRDRSSAGERRSRSRAFSTRSWSLRCLSKQRLRIEHDRSEFLGDTYVVLKLSPFSYLIPWSTMRIYKQIWEICLLFIE